MGDIISIIKGFEGILGAVLGSSTTLIVSDILKRKGELKLYLIKWEGCYKTYGDIGCSLLGKEDSDFYFYSFSYTLQVYNKSDVPKIMKDFKIKFYKEKEEVYSFIPNNDYTERYGAGSTMVDKMEVANIKPKEIQVLKQSGYVNENDLDIIEGTSKIKLTYYDEKDKERTILLYKSIISKNNYIPMR